MMNPAAIRFSVPLVDERPRPLVAGFDAGTTKTTILPLRGRPSPEPGTIRLAQGEEAAQRILANSAEWAMQHFGSVKLGDKRRNKRAVEIGAKMATHPKASLPSQMEDHNTLEAAYLLLNNEAISLKRLLAPSCKQTLAEAGQFPVVLFTEDTTELDYTAHPKVKGVGPIGDGKGKGLLLHSTLAVVPEGRQVLGLAHAEVVLRRPTPKPKVACTSSPEAQVWEESAKAVGRPPEGVTWVHVSDSASDDFGYMVACLDQGKDFLLRGHQERLLAWEPEAAPSAKEEERTLMAYARRLPPYPGAEYEVQVPAHDKQPARKAQVVVGLGEITIPPPVKPAPELKGHEPIKVRVVRAWEINPPPEAKEPVEWVLITSLRVDTLEDAYRVIGYYTCRWLCEDYHQCLKTGCRVEHSQLDDGADIKRLLGFAIPIAVRLLQIRQVARQTPDLLAKVVVDPLMVTVLALRQKKDETTMTIDQFWRGVAQLGGHQGRRGDGPPGWRTLWEGWSKLTYLTEGARLFLNK